GFLEKGYIPVVRWATKHRVITMIAALLLLIGTFSLYPRLETNLIGNSSQNTFSINLQLPPGTSLDRTNKAAQQVENVLNGVQGIQTYQVTVGSNGAAFSLSASGSDNASFAVTTDANADQAAIQKKVRDQLNALTDIGTFTISGSQQAGGTSTITVN